jgi:tetratricopeptide (TPR) repeat protein
MISVCLLAGQLSMARPWLEKMQSENPQDLMLWTLWGQWALQEGTEKELIRVAEEGLAALEPDTYDFLTVAAELLIRARRWDQAQSVIQRLADRQERPEIISYLEGLLAQTRGDWPGAVAAWRKVVNSPENGSAVQIKLAQALEQMGDRTAAIQQLHNLLNQSPNDLTAHSLLARWNADAGLWTEALDHIRQALRIQPEDLFLRKQMMEIKIRQAQEANVPLEDEEWNQLQKAWETQSAEDPAYSFIQVQVCLRKGQIEEAESRLNQIEKTGADQLRIQLLWAELMLARQQVQEAERILDKAISQYPQSLEPIQKRVVLYIQKKEYRACLEMLQRLQEQMTDESKLKTVRLWTVEIQILAGQEKEAVEGLKAVIAADSRDITVRRRLLDLTLKTESIPQLQQQIDEIKKLEGEAGRQWRYEQARMLFERGDIRRDYPQIVSILEGVLRDYPEDQSSRILLASGHEAAGNLRLAIREYQSALARDPENLDLVVAAVSAMYQAEEYQQAGAVIEMISRRGLRDPRLARLEAQHLLKEGKFGSASELLKEMMASSPEDQNIQLSLALIYLYQNRLEEAEQRIEHLHQSNPDSLSVIAARVELALRKQEPQEAIRICDEAISRLDNPQLYTLRAVTSAKLGNRDQAEKDLRKMLALNQNDRDSLIQAADLFVYIGKPKEAGQILEQTVAQRPDDFIVLKKAALINARDPQRKEAAGRFLERSLAMQPKDPELRLLKAQFLLAENTAVSTEEAEAIITRLVQEYPRLESAWITLADWYYRGGQAGRAMDYVLRGLGFFPESKPLLLLKAQIEGMQGGHLAVPTLHNMHSRFPEDDRITAILAETCLRAGQTEEALAVLTKRMGNSSDQVPVFLEQIYMMALYKKGQIQEARRLYEKMDREGRDPAGTLVRWAQLLVEAQEWKALNDLFKQKGRETSELLGTISDYCLRIGLEEEAGGREMAADCLSFLIAEHPDQPALYLSLGRLYHYWKQYPSAEMIYRKILALDNPADQSIKVIALNNLAWILAHEFSNFGEALQMADSGLAIQPDHPDLLDTRGEIYFMTGEYEKARKDLEKSIQLCPVNSPKRVESGCRLVKTLIRLQKIQEAKEVYKQIERWNQTHMTLSNEQLNELQDLLKLS